MHRFTFGSILSVAVLLGLTPSRADAQQAFFVETRGALVLPAGALADFEKPGGGFGFGIAIGVHPRIRLRGDFDALFMEGKRQFSDAVIPGVNLFHGVAGVEVLLSPDPGGESPVTVTANLGAGTTRFQVEAFVVDDGQTFILDERYRTANGGLRLAYSLGRHFSLVVGGQGYLTFVDDEDMAILAPLGIEPFERAWSFPISAGLRVGL